MMDEIKELAELIIREFALHKFICMLIIAESVLLIVVLICIPWYAAKKAKDRKLPLKGLALPEGSVRSMLALMVVGSLVVLIVFGGPIMKESENFAQAVSALTGIAGSILGFYFGTRSNDKSDSSNQKSDSSN